MALYNDESASFLGSNRNNMMSKVKGALRMSNVETGVAVSNCAPQPLLQM